MKIQRRTWQVQAHVADPVCCWEQKAKWSALLQLCIIIVLARHLESPSVVSAKDAIPPFVAEGRLSTQSFRTERTNLNYKTEADVFFLYSNGWWQVEVKYLNPGTGTPSIHNCMKIPDGTRTYMLFEGDTRTGMTTAEACPNAFPPPGRPEMLVTWLSLCPHPELPLIDGKRMRRFINLPHYRPDVFNHPQNEGYYDVKYLNRGNRGNAFISELDVTNNGFSIELNVVGSGDVEGEILRLPAPFKNGFTELQYKILESTNLNGMAFPLRAVYKRFSPNWGGKDRDDLRVGLLSELIVKRISFSEEDVARRRSAPATLIAYDARPPNLPKNITVSYRVHNDQWKPLSDPEIALEIRRAREAGNR